MSMTTWSGFTRRRKRRRRRRRAAGILYFCETNIGRTES